MVVEEFHGRPGALAELEEKSTSRVMAPMGGWILAERKGVAGASGRRSSDALSLSLIDSVLVRRFCSPPAPPPLSFWEHQVIYPRHPP